MDCFGIQTSYHFNVTYWCMFPSVSYLTCEFSLFLFSIYSFVANFLMEWVDYLTYIVRSFPSIFLFLEMITYVHLISSGIWSIWILLHNVYKKLHYITVIQYCKAKLNILILYIKNSTRWASGALEPECSAAIDLVTSVKRYVLGYPCAIFALLYELTF